MPGPIRENGLKRPLLIKGDRYNFNPHMGVALAETGPSANELAERMDEGREVSEAETRCDTNIHTCTHAHCVVCSRLCKGLMVGVSLTD